MAWKGGGGLQGVHGGEVRDTQSGVRVGRRTPWLLLRFCVMYTLPICTMYWFSLCLMDWYALKPLQIRARRGAWLSACLSVPPDAKAGGRSHGVWRGSGAHQESGKMNSTTSTNQSIHESCCPHTS